MAFVNRIRHVFSDPYVAFCASITNRKFDDALYYINQMSDKDINRPVSVLMAKQLKTLRNYCGFSPLMLVASFTSAERKTKRDKLILALLERGADLYFIKPVQEEETPWFKKGESFFTVLLHPSQSTMWVLQPYLDVHRTVSSDGCNVLAKSLHNEYFNELLTVLTPQQIKEGLLCPSKMKTSLLTQVAGTTYTIDDFKSVVQIAKAVGIDLNTPDLNGETIASCCIKWESKVSEKVGYLLSNGLDINAPAYRGETLLMKAIRDGLYPFGHKAFQMILKNSDVNIRTTQGGPSALCLAASRSFDTVIMSLLHAGAEILPQDEEIIISGILKNERILDMEERVDLLRAVQSQIQPDSFKRLLEKGLRDIHRDENDAPLSSDVSLIRMALEEDDIHLASLLIEIGVSPLDSKGRASDGIMFQDPEFKDLLMLYEEVFERRENNELSLINYEEVVRQSTFLNNKNQRQINFLGILGSLSNCLNHSDRQALVIGDTQLSRAGLFKIKCAQYVLNHQLHEKE